MESFPKGTGKWPVHTSEKVIIVKHSPLIKEFFKSSNYINLHIQRIVLVYHASQTPLTRELPYDRIFINNKVVC
jgi:hypothetical protein